MDNYNLNGYTSGDRLNALRRLMETQAAPEITDRQMPKAAYCRNERATNYSTVPYVNNHIHTIYSFSPYSPTNAAYTAWISGLATAGIMDHDSVSGAMEFVEAGKIAGIATTVGFECRCSMAGTPFEGIRLNNPDQNTIAYLAMHGIPHQNIAKAAAFLAPYCEKRNVRNRLMIERLNKLTASVKLNFEQDVAPLSQHKEGGSITERHILYALSEKLMKEIGRGAVLLDYLTGKLGLTVSASAKEKLMDTQNEMYAYYLLGVLKSELVESFYIEATDECPSVFEFLRFADEIGAIPAYAYLGDVGDSVTGDKKTQAFEDAYIEDLVAWLSKAGFKAVTYMPSRNTLEQLKKIITLCEKHGLFQISGEDINSPFQSFICEALQRSDFKHLITSTWALVGHEKAASINQADGMFSSETIAKMPDLNQRIEFFADMGRNKTAYTPVK